MYIYIFVHIYMFLYVYKCRYIFVYIHKVYIYIHVYVYIYIHIHTHRYNYTDTYITNMFFFAYPPGPKRCGFCGSCDRFTQDLKDQIEMILTWVAYETAQPCRLAVELGRETAWDCKTMWHEFPQRRGSFMRARLLQALCALERDDCVSICFIYDINYQWFFSSRDWSHG